MLCAMLDQPISLQGEHCRFSLAKTRFADALSHSLQPGLVGRGRRHTCAQPNTHPGSHACIPICSSVTSPPHRAIPPAALPGPPLTAVTACH